VPVTMLRQAFTSRVRVRERRARDDPGDYKPLAPSDAADVHRALLDGAALLGIPEARDARKGRGGSGTGETAAPASSERPAP